MQHKDVLEGALFSHSNIGLLADRRRFFYLDCTARASAEVVVSVFGTGMAQSGRLDSRTQSEVGESSWDHLANAAAKVANGMMTGVAKTPVQRYIVFVESELGWAVKENLAAVAYEHWSIATQTVTIFPVVQSLMEDYRQTAHERNCHLPQIQSSLEVSHAQDLTSRSCYIVG